MSNILKLYMKSRLATVVGLAVNAVAFVVGVLSVTAGGNIVANLFVTAVSGTLTVLLGRQLCKEFVQG